MRSLIISLALVIAACTPRGAMVLVDGAADSAEVLPIYFATTRTADETGFDVYGGGRSAASTYGRFDVSIPQDRVAGDITYPTAQPDLATDFVATNRYGYATPEVFRNELRQQLRARPDRSVIIYVHGFNTKFGEGMMRLAQLSHDLDLPGIGVHYSWPSIGNPLGYSYDHDSVLFARDGLQELLEQIDAAGADDVILVGHSIGSLLVMEALRQIEIQTPGRASRIVDGVVLISPDVDIELFRKQVDRIGTLPDPFVIFHSRRDRLLALSAGLTGQTERLGNIRDVERVADLNLTLFDVSEFGRGAHHFTVGNSPALLAVLGRVSDVDSAFQADLTSRIGLFPGTVLTLRNATQIILSPITILP
ncbi:MAG: esterase/lipase superfamily enzyme [Paracoccaceae bacterium]|jgi:esterase/lipase superfamily enzyme